MNETMVNTVVELSFESSVIYVDPFHQVSLSVKFTDPKGVETLVPGFWTGGQRWAVRFSSLVEGLFTYETFCNDESNLDLHAQSGKIQVIPYVGNNPLYQHGGLGVMADQRHLQHADGTPFLWLADTWWLGFTKRISFPEEFDWLVQDRLQKGFNVVQIVAGLYPDMDYYDERGANEAGFPWAKDFSTINPDYFEKVDQRIAYLIEAGITPCIVGSWGYFMDFAGMEVLKKHWENLIARYAAYPVVWCAAGEGLMDYYLADKSEDPEVRRQTRRAEWSELIRHIRALDPFQRLVTIHPTQYGHEQLSDPDLIDFDMLQTGHDGYPAQGPTIDMVNKALAHEPKMPVLNSEVNYEGIGEACREEIQRFHFWSCFLSGAMGHTYGANGLWQLNRRGDPYGPSPHGMSWGDVPWQDAAQLPGSGQIGLGKQMLENYPWWKFEVHPEWTNVPQTETDRLRCYAAGIPNEIRMIFFPANMAWVAWNKKMKVLALEEGINYQCSFFSPKDGKRMDLGVCEEAEYVVPVPPVFQDWVLVLEAIKE